MPREVLETAAGTGVLTRAIASRLPTEARIVATDLNKPMLDRAAAIQPHDQRIEWLQADALALPFEDQEFDVVACQFGAMFFADKVLGYREAHRVLRTGGHFLFNVWDQISQNEFANVITQALAALFPQNPPAFLVRTPHGYHEVAKIRGDLAEAGFKSISVETRQDISLANSPRDVAIAYCQGTPLRNEIEDRNPLGLEKATQASADALAKQFGTGPIQSRTRAHVITAIR